MTSLWGDSLHWDQRVHGAPDITAHSVLARAYFVPDCTKMRKSNLLPQCEGVTMHGEPCKMTVDRLGLRLCRYHDPRTRDAVIADNRRRLQAYWQRRRAATAA
jgi:hypothetical protein